MGDLAYYVQNPFAFIVIPGLTKLAPYTIRGNPGVIRAKADTVPRLDPDFHREPWIPAEVYPVT